MRLRDDLLIWNERIKLFAGFLNAAALGLVAFAVLRPATEDLTLLNTVSAGWGSVGLAIHGLAVYILGYLRKDTSDGL